MAKVKRNNNNSNNDTTTTQTATTETDTEIKIAAKENEFPSRYSTKITTTLKKQRKKCIIKQVYEG